MIFEGIFGWINRFVLSCGVWRMLVNRKMLFFLPVLLAGALACSLDGSKKVDQEQAADVLHTQGAGHKAPHEDGLLPRLPLQIPTNFGYLIVGETYAFSADGFGGLKYMGCLSCTQNVAEKELDTSLDKSFGQPFDPCHTHYTRPFRFVELFRLEVDVEILAQARAFETRNANQDQGSFQSFGSSTKFEVYGDAQQGVTARGMRIIGNLHPIWNFKGFYTTRTFDGPTRGVCWPGGRYYSRSLCQGLQNYCTTGQYISQD